MSKQLIYRAILEKVLSVGDEVRFMEHLFDGGSVTIDVKTRELVYATVEQLDAMDSELRRKAEAFDRISNFADKELWDGAFNFRPQDFEQHLRSLLVELKELRERDEAFKDFCDNVLLKKNQAFCPQCREVRQVSGGRCDFCDFGVRRSAEYVEGKLYGFTSKGTYPKVYEPDSAAMHKWFEGLRREHRCIFCSCGASLYDFSEAYLDEHWSTAHARDAWKSEHFKCSLAINESQDFLEIPQIV